jgi:transcriptional regulator with XRE-family HTH domain
MAVDKISAIYVEVGRAVRSYRLKAGLTQEQLAVRVGLSRSSITHIEAGEHRFQIHTLYLIAEALGTSPDSLLARAEDLRRQRTQCQICKIDLEAVYGDLSQKFLSVGHITRFSPDGEDTTDDLYILCANCQQMIDSNPGLTPQKLAKRVRALKANEI